MQSQPTVQRHKLKFKQNSQQAENSFNKTTIKQTAKPNKSQHKTTTFKPTTNNVDKSKAANTTNQTKGVRQFRRKTGNPQEGISKSKPSSDTPETNPTITTLETK